MPQEIKITVYTYDELSDAAKAKACDWYRTSSINEEWWESTYEDAAQAGIKITGFDLYNNTISGKLTMSAIDVALRIQKEHGEACGTRSLAEGFIELFSEYHGVNGKITLAGDDEAMSPDDYHSLLEAFEEKEEAFTKALLKEYLSMLQKENDFQTSEETVADNIRCNDYTFTEDGKRFG